MKLLFVVNTLTEFLSFSYIECKLFAYLYKDFVRQLKAFLPSFYHLCAYEMSPGWGHLITWMDAFERHFGPGRKELKSNALRVSLGGGGGDVEASIWLIHNSDYLFGEEKDVQWSYSGSLLHVSMWKNFKWNFVLVVVLYLEFKALYYYNNYNIT